MHASIDLGRGDDGRLNSQHGSRESSVKSREKAGKKSQNLFSNRVLVRPEEPAACLRRQVRKALTAATGFACLCALAARREIVRSCTGRKSLPSCEGFL